MQRFEGRAQFIEIERCNAVADVLTMQHQTLGHQHLERLAQRRLGDIEHFTERTLVDTGAGRQFAFFDEGAQTRGDFGRHAERAQARGLEQRLGHRRHQNGEDAPQKAITHRYYAFGMQ